MKHLDLKGGGKMPVLGFGTWQNEGQSCTDAVKAALEIGYRHIDTAQDYGNEAEVGQGLKESGMAREDFFLTTKVFKPEFDSKEKALDSIKESLRKLQTDYADLILVHWPFPDYTIEQLIEPMLEAQDKGMTKAIGVSNFTVNHMEEAKRISDDRICLNQVEYHPTLSQAPVLDWIRENGWQMTAYSPLCRGEVMENETIKDIASKYNKNPAQVSLRWILQQDNVAAIPKSSSVEHIQSNFDVFDFELTEQEMNSIFALGDQENRKVSPGFAPEWDNAKAA